MPNLNRWIKFQTRFDSTAVIFYYQLIILVYFIKHLYKRVRFKCNYFLLTFKSGTKINITLYILYTKDILIKIMDSKIIKITCIILKTFNSLNSSNKIQLK